MVIPVKNASFSLCWYINIQGDEELVNTPTMMIAEKADDMIIEDSNTWMKK